MVDKVQSATAFEKRDKRGKNINVRLSEAEYQKLATAAGGTSMAEFIREAIGEKIERK